MVSSNLNMSEMGLKEAKIWVGTWSKRSILSYFVLSSGIIGAGKLGETFREVENKFIEHQKYLATEPRGLEFLLISCGMFFILNNTQTQSINVSNVMIVLILKIQYRKLRVPSYKTPAYYSIRKTLI